MPHEEPVEFQGAPQPAESKFGGVLAESPASKFGGIPFETSISAVPEPKKQFRTTRLGTKVERPPTRREILENEFGFKNLDTVLGGNVAARLAGSLGDLDDVRLQLAKQFNVEPEEIDLGNFDRVGIVFKNPDTGEFEPLDVPGFDPEDFAVAGAEVPVIAAEIAGGFAGLRGGAAGVVAGVGLGAGVARASQLAILEKMGIITPADGEILKRAGTDVALASTFAAAPTAGRVLKGALSPRLRALNRLETGGVTSGALREGKKQLAPLEAASGAEFSAGQRVAQVDELAGRRLRATELSEKVESGELGRVISNEAAEVKLKIALVDGSADPIIIGREISNVARQQYLTRVDEIVQAISAKIRKVEGQLAEFSGIAGATAGSVIRTTLDEGRETIFATLSAQYNEILEQVPATTKIDTRGLVAVGNKWQARLNEDIFPSLAPEDLALVKNALAVNRRGPAPIGDNLPPIGRALTPDATPKKTATRLAATSRALSILKEELRFIGSPLGGAKIRQKRLLIDLVDELQSARDKALMSIDPEIAAQVRSQDSLWRLAKEKIDGALVGAILQRKSGVFNIADDAVFRNIIKSEANLRDYIKLVDDFPALNAVDDIKRAFDGLYTEQVVEGNIKHATWLARNRKTLEVVYSPEEMGRFRDAGLLQDELVQIANNEKRLIKELQGGPDADGFRNPNTGFVYKLGRFDPEEAVRATKGSPSNARRMMNLLEGDKAKAFQDVRMQQLMEDTGGRPESLKRALTGDSRRELGIIFGPEHMDNLDQLLRLSEVNAIPGSVNFLKGAAEQPDVYSTTRKLIVGPLDRLGYRIRVATRMFPAASDSAMIKILRDPDKLETLLRTNETRLANRAYWNFVTGTLGFTINDIINMTENDQLGPEQSRDQLMKLMKGSQ